MVKNSEYWKSVEDRLKELQKMRADISKEIHLLKVSIAQHKRRKNASETQKSFGKKFCDFTAEEKREYWKKTNARHYERRKK